MEWNFRKKKKWGGTVASLFLGEASILCFRFCAYSRKLAGTQCLLGKLVKPHPGFRIYGAEMDRLTLIACQVRSWKVPLYLKPFIIHKFQMYITNEIVSANVL